LVGVDAVPVILILCALYAFTPYYLLSKIENPLTFLKYYIIVFQALILYAQLIAKISYKGQSITFLQATLTNPIKFWYVAVYLISVFLVLTLYLTPYGKQKRGAQATSILATINMLTSWAIIFASIDANPENTLEWALFTIKLMGPLSILLPQILWSSIYSGSRSPFTIKILDALKEKHDLSKLIPVYAEIQEKSVKEADIKAMKEPAQFVLKLEGKSSILHTLDCPIFREKGVTEKGWYHPFKSYQEAFTYGSSIEGRSYPKLCAKCRPWLQSDTLTEAEASFQIQNTKIEDLYVCIESWLAGTGAKIEEKEAPRSLIAKTRSESTYMIEVYSEHTEFTLSEKDGDIEVKVRLWIDTYIDGTYPVGINASILRLNEVKKSLIGFIKESTKEYDPQTVYTVRDAFSNLRNSRPLLSKVSEVDLTDEKPSQTLTILIVILSLVLVTLYGGFFYMFDLSPYTEHIIGLVFTYGAAAALIYWVYLSDRREKEPLVYIALMFSWGIFSGLIASQLNGFIADILPLPSPLVAPFVEEPVKALGLYVFLTHRLTREEFNSPLDGVMYGFVVGIGFYAAENFIYYLVYDFSTLLVRIFMCWGHGLYVAVVGLWVAVNRHYRGYNTPSDILPGLGVAVFLHFLWNGWSYFGGLGGQLLLYQSIFNLGYLKKIINEGRRDELYSGGGRVVFSALDVESANRRAQTGVFLVVIVLLGFSSMFVYGTRYVKSRSNDWVVYDDYGFSFMYPERLWYETRGEYEGEEASEGYGEIWFGNYRGQKRELLKIVYGSYGKIGFWDTGYSTDLVGENISLGKEGSFTICGHRGLYRNMTMISQGEEFRCVISGWGCKDAWKCFYVQYYTVDDDSYETWQKVINSFKCHEIK